MFIVRPSRAVLNIDPAEVDTYAEMKTASVHYDILSSGQVVLQYDLLVLPRQEYLSFPIDIFYREGAAVIIDSVQVAVATEKDQPLIYQDLPPASGVHNALDSSGKPLARYYTLFTGTNQINLLLRAPVDTGSRVHYRVKATLDHYLDVWEDGLAFQYTLFGGSSAGFYDSLQIKVSWPQPIASDELSVYFQMLNPHLGWVRNGKLGRSLSVDIDTGFHRPGGSLVDPLADHTEPAPAPSSGSGSTSCNIDVDSFPKGSNLSFIVALPWRSFGTTYEEAKLRTPNIFMQSQKIDSQQAQVSKFRLQIRQLALYTNLRVTVNIIAIVAAVLFPILLIALIFTRWKRRKKQIRELVREEHSSTVELLLDIASDKATLLAYHVGSSSGILMLLNLIAMIRKGWLKIKHNRIILSEKSHLFLSNGSGVISDEVDSNQHLKTSSIQLLTLLSSVMPSAGTTNEEERGGLAWSDFKTIATDLTTRIKFRRGLAVFQDLLRETHSADAEDRGLSLRYALPYYILSAIYVLISVLFMALNGNLLYLLFLIPSTLFLALALSTHVPKQNMAMYKVRALILRDRLLFADDFWSETLSELTELDYLTTAIALNCSEAFLKRIINNHASELPDSRIEAFGERLLAELSELNLFVDAESVNRDYTDIYLYLGDVLAIFNSPELLSVLDR